MLLQTKYNDNLGDFEEDELSYGDDPLLYTDEEDDFNQDYDDDDCEEMAEEICHTSDGKHINFEKFYSVLIFNDSISSSWCPHKMFQSHSSTSDTRCTQRLTWS